MTANITPNTVITKKPSRLKLKLKMFACPLVVNGVELVSSWFWWCRASLEPVVVMAYGKNGATCWRAGAVRTLQKRVEMLEAKDSVKNVECSIHANTSDFEIQNTSPKVQVPRHEPASDLEHGVATLLMMTCKIWSLQCMEMTSSRY